MSIDGFLSWAFAFLTGFFAATLTVCAWASILLPRLMRAAVEFSPPGAVPGAVETPAEPLPTPPADPAVDPGRVLRSFGPPVEGRDFTRMPQGASEVIGLGKPPCKP